MAMAVMPFVAFSQVKQVFQIFDYETKKPLVGVTNTLYGQTVTSNAQGVAVVNLPADKKGTYLVYEDWQLDGYSYLGRFPESFYIYFQGKDTIKLYMVETSKYRKAIDRVFEKLYRFRYEQEVMPVFNKFVEDLKANPGTASVRASNLVEATMSRDPVVRNSYEDAISINIYDLYKYANPQFDEVKQILQTGDVNKAIEMAKQHVDLTDNSRLSMEWIDFYRDLRDLEFSTEDDDPVSNYTEVLYKNHFSPVSPVFYIQDLNRDLLYDKADSVSAIEKANNVVPRYESAYEPSAFRYILQDNNPAKLKMISENSLNIIKKVCQQYPYSTTYGDVAWNYKNIFLSYSAMEDSVLASQSIDSCLYYKQKFLDACGDNRFTRNQKEIRFNQYVIDYLAYGLQYVPENTLYRLYDEVYNLSKENYLTDTANLFLKVQLAENALLWLQKAPEIEGSDEKRAEVMNQLVDVNFSLSKDFPEFYAVQNVQVTSQLVGNCLMNQCNNEQMQAAFSKYERSFDIVNALYPKAFVDIYLRYNRMLDGFLTANQMFVLSSELSDFNDRLLSIKADNDPQKILVQKAEFANEMAETLFQNEMYEESVTYYLRSNEFYMQAMPKNDSLWIPYLMNYLQMGDAHLYQNQFDKAVMTYQKILDYESQIPASMMPQYTSMKANVSYYVGDVYKATGDMKRAEKEYKNAEKLFKKAISMGNVSAYQSMGEMYWGKAVAAAQNEDMKTCRNMTALAVIYYEKAPFERPLNRYVQAKSVMGEFYKQDQDAENYYRTARDLEAYFKKFVDYEEGYAGEMAKYAEIMLKSGTITNEEALVYSHDVLNGLMYLNDAGEDVKLPYLRGVFNLARAYTVNDSVLEAIELYRSCLTMNEIMYKDTAEESYKNNMLEIYLKIAGCYEIMADEIDTAHSEIWNYRAIDARDTVITLMKELAGDGDVNMTYRTAVQYKNNAVVLYEIDMLSSAQDYMDKSIELLMMLYNSEYKTEVEEDVVFHYYLKGVMYEEKGNNDERAIENLRKAVEYGEKSDTSQGVSRYYFISVNELIEILSKDASANAAELTTLKKTQKQLAKYFK
jgi:tetratricopeptide (TPR) repeat protein